MAREQVWDATGGQWVTVSGVASVVSSNTDADAIHDNVSGEIFAVTVKSVPIDADLLLIEDSAVSNSKKKITIGTLPFDTFPAGMMTMYGAAAAPTGWLLCDGAAVSQATYADLYAVIGLAYGNPGGGNFNLPDLRQSFPLGKADAGTGSTLGDTGGAIDHTHTGPSHVHTMGTHTHTGPSHVHTMPTHTHTGPSHAHTMGTHTHYVSGTTSGPGNWGTAQSGTGVTMPSQGHTHTWSDTSNSTDPGDTNSGGTGNTGATDPGDTNAGGTGNTGATDPGDTNAGGTANTGTQNPPFVVVNFIIKT